MYKKLSEPTAELNVPKLNGLANIKKTLTGVSPTVTRKIKITDFRLSIFNKYFSNNVEIVFVSNSVKRGIRVHTDTYTINTDRKIGTPSNKATIKLIDDTIKQTSKLDNVFKSLSFIIKMLTRDNTLQLMGSVSGENKTHRFLIAKYSESITGALINLYRDIHNSDKIIIDYIRLTYRKA
jgi:hypothetical protein